MKKILISLLVEVITQSSLLWLLVNLESSLFGCLLLDEGGSFLFYLFNVFIPKGFLYEVLFNYRLKIFGLLGEVSREFCLFQLRGKRILFLGVADDLYGIWITVVMIWPFVIIQFIVYLITKVHELVYFVVYDRFHLCFALNLCGLWWFWLLLYWLMLGILLICH